jgi:Spy/CpxP family protein refolding chaperone
MKRARIVMVVMQVFLVLAIASTSLAEEGCPGCGLEISEASPKFTVYYNDGAEKTFGCPHCAMREILKGNMKSAKAMDYLRREMIDAKEAFYLKDTEVGGCCEPFWLSFATRKEAEKFSKGFGGEVLAYDEALKVIEAEAGEGRHRHGKGHLCGTMAGMHRGGYIHNYVSMYKKHSKELGLNQSQIAKLSAIDDECSKSCDSLSNEIAGEEESLNRLMQDETINIKAIKKKIKEIHNLRAKLEISHFERLGKVQKILSLEQRKKCKKMCNKKMDSGWPMIH